MSAPIVRPAAVAGRFYPGDSQSLLNEVRTLLAGGAEPQPALGCVVPHAGYMYSGHVAGAVYARVRVPGRCIVLCPNHTGRGHALSIMSRGSWLTPLGPVAIDDELADSLKDRCAGLTESPEAHRAEHAVEVQLPFLQACRASFVFVPIAVGTGDFGRLEDLGEALAEVVSAQEEPVLLLASSDMNHYESDPETRVKDRKAIEKVLALDPEGLFEVVTREDISMCGVGPTVAMLIASRAMGAESAQLVRYATSGDVTGDRDAVVGYAGIIVR